MKNIVLLTGLAQEAATITRLPGTIVLTGAVDRDKTLATLNPDDIAGIISYGTCGGLSPEIKVGSVIVSRKLVLDDGTVIKPDVTWANAIVTGLLPLPVQIYVTSTFSNAVEMGSTILEKAKLYKRTKADTVDLGSYAVAQWAQTHKKPFAIIGAVSDGFDDTVPSDPLLMRPDGSIDVMRAIEDIIYNPGDLWLFLKEAKLFSSAINALGRVNGLIGNGWEFPY